MAEASVQILQNVEGAHPAVDLVGHVVVDRHRNHDCPDAEEQPRQGHPLLGGEQPEDAVEVKAVEPPKKAVKPANKARKAATK